MASYLLPDHADRLQRARLCLEGLSLGDSFGQRFFGQSTKSFLLKEKALPAPPWRYTDDTEMAISVFGTLAEHGGIEQDDLANRFAQRFANDPYRGYAHGAVELLEGILRGESWRETASQLFDGQGSMGNGSAMRVGPVGAYFADDLEAVIEHAAASAEITHAHPEGRAGAIAVALAAAYACSMREDASLAARDMIDFVLEQTPPGETFERLEQAARIPFSTPALSAAGALGNGSHVLCQDTVPFCIWNAARELNNYQQALWTTVSVHGDMDTTCAIVGGIVALAVGEEGLPTEWLAAREPLAC